MTDAIVNAPLDTPPPAKKKRRKEKPVLTPLEREGKLLGLYMTLPAQLLLIFIVLFPLFMQVYVSLSWWTPLDGEKWYDAYETLNWFGNYRDIFDDSKFWGSLGRTFLIVAVVVPIEFLLGLGLATLFVDKFPGKRIFYSIMLMPMMIVPAVAAYMFFMLFQNNGPINDILTRIAGERVDILWLADPNLAMVSVMIADIWQWTPLMFLILLAGMVGVPEDQMKAATLLGANAWHRFWRIVLPRMKVVMIIAIVIRTVECFKIFDILYIMTGGGPGVATKSISVYIYDLTDKDQNWSYVAAIGLFILVCLSIIAVVGINRMQAAQKKAEA
jgi:multiple sugar transport system permease protein